MRNRPLVVVLVVAALISAACSGAKKPSAAKKVSANDTSTSTTAGPDATTPTSAGSSATAASSTGAKPGTRTGAAAGAKGHSAPGSSVVPHDVAGDPALYSGAINTRGITAQEIHMCAHAALLFGPAFNATKEDLSVHLQAVNDAGGVFGRNVTMDFQDDRYDPATAVQAAQACQAENPFMILGGIGFDQIPSVRKWAEDNKELYFYHIATENGAAGNVYSFTTQSSVEAAGRSFAELAATRFPTKKIGILYRNSEYWKPGVDAFVAVAKAKGLKVGTAIGVTKNQGAYQLEESQLKAEGDEVVWAWENTIALTQMVQQDKAQSYNFQWMGFPFNLTSQTLGNDALNPPLVGLATWPGYSKGDYTGTFASYAGDMKQFEAEYAKYRPNTDIGGVAGDLLWLNWIEQKRLIDLLTTCGAACTRNHLAGVMKNWKSTVSPNCPLDFSGGRHNGSGDFLDVFETYMSPSGKVNWRSTKRCRQHSFA